MTDIQKCPMCGARALRAVEHTRDVVADDGGHLQFHDELMECSACGERHYTHEQAMASSRARAGALRQHAGLLTPDEIRSFREQNGLSQAQLESVLQTGAKTVVRWEKGTVCQSRAADQLLRLLMANAWNLRLLTEGAIANVAHPGLEPMLTQNVVVSIQLGPEASLASNAAFAHAGKGKVFLDEAIVSPPSTAPALVADASPASGADYARAA
jgi:putative zinc finger/helix-turn-helix YgiT family protein